MAVIAPTIVPVGNMDGSIVRVTWTPVIETDTCAPASLPEFADKSIQVFGSFGGTSVALHGSNDGGTTFAALNIPAGTAIAITTTSIKQVLENTEQIKPVLTGGTSTSISVVVLCRLANPLRT